MPAQTLWLRIICSEGSERGMREVLGVANLIVVTRFCKGKHEEAKAQHERTDEHEMSAGGS